MERVKTLRESKGIKIIGDMPIYVAADSVEVWTKPELFQLDEERNPLFVAGSQPINSVQQDNFGAIRFTLGKNIKTRLRLVDSPH